MRYFVLLGLCFISFFASAQLTLSGKVIEEFDLIGMPGVRIMTSDTLELATTDLDGNFEIQLPIQADTLLLGSVGMEWMLIKLPTNCSRLEMVMMPYVVYDFITARTQDRKRYRRFRSLSSKHKQAFEKGIFKSATPCFNYIFERYASRQIDPN